MKKTSVVDIEASDWTDFKCLGFFDGEDYKVFWSIEGFLDFFLTREYRGFKCYAHFGGKYDFRFFIDYLVSCERFDLRLLERGSKIMSIKVIDKKSKSSWTFADSYFILPLSLRKLGENFKIQYMKKDFDVSNEKDFKSAEAQEYLKNDCLGLFEILEKFSQWGLNGGKLKSTLPSQSLHIFSKNFLEKKLFPLKPIEEEFIRKTYFGGRVEIFKTYGKDLFYYDYNGLYSYAMLEDMPIGSICYVKSYYPNLIGFYHIKTDIPYEKIPLLPKIIQDKLIFPYGDGDFYSTSAELEILRKKGIKFEVLEGYVFNDKYPIFKNYILEMYKIRNSYEKGTMENLISKLLMNSLYGRFGMKREQKELLFSKNPPKNARVFDEDFGLYELDTISKSPYILPHLSSYITSLGRVKLYNTFEKVGHENVWYCDTDSIITSKELPVGEGLGELKLEHKIKEGVFLQPKAYSFITQDNKTFSRVKGMPDISISFNDFKKALFENNLSIINTKYYNLTGFREELRKNNSLKMTRQVYTKELRNEYNKRKIEGIDTIPLKMFDNSLKLK